VRRLLAIAAAACLLLVVVFSAKLALRDESEAPRSQVETHFTYYIDSAIPKCGVPPYKPCPADRQHEFSQEQG
jgi:hypothetical protein